MSRKSGPRKQKKKLALLWVDEQFEVPIQTSLPSRLPTVPGQRSIVLLEPIVRRVTERRTAVKR